MNMKTLRLKHRLKTRSFFSLLGCFVSGLYLEGADWDIEKGCLVRSKPRVLVSQLPILKIIPIEAHRLKLQARCFIFFYIMSWNICLEILEICKQCVFLVYFLEHPEDSSLHHLHEEECYGCWTGVWGWSFHHQAHFSLGTAGSMSVPQCWLIV